jgi:hypothetical protein
MESFYIRLGVYRPTFDRERYLVTIVYVEPSPKCWTGKAAQTAGGSLLVAISSYFALRPKQRLLDVS